MMIKYKPTKQILFFFNHIYHRCSTFLFILGNHESSEKSNLSPWILSLEIIVTFSWRTELVASISTLFMSFFFIIVFIWNSFCSRNFSMYSKLGVRRPLLVITARLSSGIRFCSSIGRLASLLTKSGIHPLSSRLKCIATNEIHTYMHHRPTRKAGSLPPSRETSRVHTDYPSFPLL